MLNTLLSLDSLEAGAQAEVNPCKNCHRPDLDDIVNGASGAAVIDDLKRRMNRDTNVSQAAHNRSAHQLGKLKPG